MNQTEGGHACSRNPSHPTPSVLLLPLHPQVRHPEGRAQEAVSHICSYSGTKHRVWTDHV